MAGQPAPHTLRENPERERYELHVDGRLAGFAEYRGGGATRAFTHTEVTPEFEGRGLGSELIRGALDDVRRRQLHVIPMCPFTRAFLAGHHEYLDLVEPAIRRAFNLPEPAGDQARLGSSRAGSPEAAARRPSSR